MQVVASKLSIIILLIIILQQAQGEYKLIDKLQKLIKIHLLKESFEAIKNMHINWYNHALKALIGQLGKQLYRNFVEDDRQHYLQCLNRITNEADLSAGAKCIVEARKRLLINRKNYVKWTTSEPLSKFVSQNKFNKTNEHESPTFPPISSERRNEKELKANLSAQHLTNRVFRDSFESRIQQSLKENDCIQQIHQARKYPRQIQLPEVQTRSSPTRRGNADQRRWVLELQKRKELAYERNHWQITTTNIHLQDNTTKRISTIHPTKIKTSTEGSSYVNFHHKFKRYTANELPINSGIINYQRRKRSLYRLITN